MRKISTSDWSWTTRWIRYKTREIIRYGTFISAIKYLRAAGIRKCIDLSLSAAINMAREQAIRVEEIDDSQETV